jgi:hypothetical protein
VELPISRGALDRLGKRLVSPDGITDADAELFSQILRVYDQALAAVCNQLRIRHFRVTNRLKTEGTLLDKLRREHSLKLKDVHDLAGARISIAGGRAEQDDAVGRITAAFAAGSKPPQVRDRRAKPSSGYRAVHVVVFLDGIPVEIQIRTELQHTWAQAYELMGDAWGRDIRYGGEPLEPDAPAISGEPGPSRAAVVAAMLSIAGVIDRFEMAEAAGRADESTSLAVERAGLFMLLRSTIQLFRQPNQAADEAEAEVSQ